LIFRQKKTIYLIKMAYHKVIDKKVYRFFINKYPNVAALVARGAE